MKRLEQQLRFLMELDKQKEIVRQTYLADGSRRETDAEHAWHLALMCMILSEYANEPIDMARTVLMVLTHDLVEIDAGDTYAYDEEAKKTQGQREKAAADRIFGLLPEDQGKYMRGVWEEFEEGETPEAKFAHTMDNIQPTMLSAATGGKGWEEHGVHLGQILDRNKNTAQGSEKLWEYSYQNFISPNLEKGKIKR